MSLSIKRAASASLGLLTLAGLLLVAGCGKTPTTATAATAATVSNASTISLSSTGTTIKSDGSNSVTLTATALTSSNAILANQALTLSASGGQLSAATVTTDATGKATFTFSAGSAGLNRTATISVAATGTTATASIPIQITGSTLTLTSTTASVATGTPVAISVTAKDAAGNPVTSQALRYSIASSSTGSGTLSASTGTTDISGMTSVNLTGTAGGTVNVLVEWLDSAGVVTASATKAFTVAAAGNTFSVVTPASSPFAVSIGTNQSVVVNVPATVASIRYATTLGSWLQVASQAGCNTLGQKVCTVSNTGTTDTQTFVPGNNAGNATVQIDALNASGTVLSSATVMLSITSPAANASKITLQSNVAVLPPSAGTTLSTATLTAKVFDAANNPVGNAPVSFELVNSTGSGESISPALTTTNATSPMGVAQAIFTAGTSTTLNSSVKASITNSAGTIISASQQLVVGGTVGSIAIGPSNKMTAVNFDTAYQLPVTIMVSDSNGNAVAGAVVTLSLWPVRYYKGNRTACVAPVTAGFANEDVNFNNTLDAGEDIDGPGAATTASLGTPDGALWPPQADSGSVPSTVTTDANGIATFNWVYLKRYANWLKVRLTASTQVQGSQSTASALLDLAALAADVAVPCSLPDSPYN